MPPSSGELWGHHLMPPSIVVDCLLPTGVIIQLSCMRDATLISVKNDLWEKSKTYPLFHKLGPAGSYIFVSITQDAEREEFYDEGRRLCDLRLFQPILKVVMPVGNKEEKMLNSEIGLAIGMPVHEFDEMKNLEMVEFRRSINNVCKEAVELREGLDEESRACYFFPPDVETSPHFPPNLRKNLDRGHFMVTVWLMNDNGDQQKFTLKVTKDCLPESVVRDTLVKNLKTSTKKHVNYKVDTRLGKYLLKVCGSTQYLLGEYPMCRYKYIRQCIAKGDIPQLLLTCRMALYNQITRSVFHMPSFLKWPPPTTVSNSQTMSLWRIDSAFKIRILWATYVNVRDVDKIYVRTGLYHGTEPLCPCLETQQVVYSNPKWDEYLTFELYIPDIPHGARLCLSICSVSKRKKKEEHYALAWGNVNLFDYKDCLLCERISIYLWPMPKGLDELLNPMGMVGSNPNKDSPCLEIEFDRFGSTVTFPSIHQIEEYANLMLMLDRQTMAYSKKAVTQAELDLIREISERDPLSEISEQEKESLWQLRNFCKDIPDSLPKLLDAVKWNSREEVAQLYLLLKDWPLVTAQTALELLDCKNADQIVRSFAVSCLDSILTDDLLSQYLLQLVQVLKFEPFLNCNLSKFLIKRALLNRKIGHFFFWHLKAEMADPSVAIKFGLLLEGFCRGIGVCLKNVVKQVEALEKLTKLTDILKERKDDTQKERLKFLYENFRQADYLEALQYFESPLNNSNILGRILVEECKILDSAKRPLWLVWENPDPMAEYMYKENSIIFKNGDDLRQDMLTLQVIQIMDAIWQNEGLDLRMLPYACLATGKNVGMIEVVRNAKTVMNIQRKGGRMAALQVDSTQLHKWIKEHNKGAKYQQAIETFTYSCAGYCVATFILGIGDRNPDNIMVNESGQIFHIDFGHFLGHFKKKFGINRERVPFVLTEDFLCVIAKGAEYPKKSKEFQNFQELCGKAFVMLRRHSHLLITLFTMMLSTDIPELQSIDDIGYLRKTLQVEKTEEEALEYFQNQFFEAYGGAWTTKLDWFFHSVKHL